MACRGIVSAPVGIDDCRLSEGSPHAQAQHGSACKDEFLHDELVMPAASAEGMNEHLKEISTQVTPGSHAALICDGAGWHQTGEKLQVPDNITLVPLPPHAPELNPMENV